MEHEFRRQPRPSNLIYEHTKHGYPSMDKDGGQTKVLCLFLTLYIEILDLEKL